MQEAPRICLCEALDDPVRLVVEVTSLALQKVNGVVARGTTRPASQTMPHHMRITALPYAVML